MPSDDESKILPPMMNDRTRPQTNRTLLGVLLALLAVAVLLALWFLIFDREGSSASDSGGRPLPTAVTVPTSTPVPPGERVAAPAPTVAPTVAPLVTPTPLPEGLEACTDTTAPLVTSSYIVDTNTTPLNQRAEPSVSAPQVGTFEPAQTGLVFTGECVVNTADGFTWWQIFNGTADVWIASAFVTPT